MYLSVLIKTDIQLFKIVLTLPIVSQTYANNVLIFLLENIVAKFNKILIQITQLLEKEISVPTNGRGQIFSAARRKSKLIFVVVNPPSI